MYWPTLKCHIFHSKLLYNSASVTSSTMKNWWKMEGKTIFQGAYGLSGTGIVVFRNHWRKSAIWYSLMAWPDWPWPPRFYGRFTPLALRVETIPSNRLTQISRPRVPKSNFCQLLTFSLHCYPSVMWNPRPLNDVKAEQRVQNLHICVFGTARRLAGTSFKEQRKFHRYVHGLFAERPTSLPGLHFVGPSAM